MIRIWQRAQVIFLSLWYCRPRINNGELFYDFIDGLIGNEAVVEIKCPYIAKDTSSAIEAINNKLVNNL